MKNKRGYILLETIVSLFIIILIVTCLYQIIILCSNIKKDVEDRTELNQQIEEMFSEIKPLLESSFNVISLTTSDNKVIYDIEYNNLYTVNSIKLDLKGDESVDSIFTKNKEISFKNNIKKIFINTIRSNNSSEPGGYEIGDYVKNIYVKLDNPKIITVILKLEKNNTIMDREIKVYMLNNKYKPIFKS